MSEEIKTEVVEEVVEQIQKSEDTPKTFTQEELDKIVAERIARERKKLEKYADYDDLKTKASEYEKQLEEKRLAELSEKERLEEVAKKYEEEKNGLQAELEAIRKQAESERIRTEFIKVATSQNIAYLDDALALADLSAVTIDESGKVVGMDEVVKTLVDNKPFLVAKKQQKQIGDSSNGNYDRSEKTAEQLLKEAAEKARLSGKPEDKIAYAKLKREING